MKIVGLADVTPRPRRVAIGMFDGVHVGHREVISGADTVLTFDPHPQSVIAPGTGPKLITTLERKAELIESLGVDELIVVTFDQERMQRPPSAFIEDTLVGALDVRWVSVGENFRFGNQAGGTPEMLAADERFETRVVALAERDDELVSSAHIRGLIAGGAVKYANELLGDPFVIDAEVVHGDKRGRELGYPTANLVPDPAFVLPGHGVYATRVRVGPDWFAAATNVGVRPQFSTGRGELIEAFLIDWDGDIYGEEIRVEFIARLRGEKRFESVNALIAEMGVDVEQARDILDC